MVTTRGLTVQLLLELLQTLLLRILELTPLRSLLLMAVRQLRRRTLHKILPYQQLLLQHLQLLF